MIDPADRNDRSLERLLQDEDGVTAIEYGLMAALIAVVCIVAFEATGVSLGDLYERWTKAVIDAL